MYIPRVNSPLELGKLPKNSKLIVWMSIQSSKTFNLINLV